MAFAEGQRGHDLGFDAPHELLRAVEGVSGEVELELELAPRPQYGLIMPLIRLEDGGARTFGAGRIERPLRGRRSRSTTSTMRASFTVDGGRAPRVLAALGAAESRQAPQPTPPDAVAARIADTVEAWRSWEAEHDIYEGPHRELVRMSSRVLKGLSYRPTGAIVAAPTTSLPETVGGERNWDYRFSWIRDSSLTIEALYIGTCSDEAEEFVSFMTSSAGGRAGEGSLQIMYGIGGEHDLSERELPHLRGWRESAPGPRRQRRLGPGPARRLRRAAQLALALPREARRPASRDPGVRGRPRRHRGAALDGDRLGDVGDARRAAPPPVLEGALLDGARPRGEAGAAARRATRRPRSGRPRATRSAPPCSSAAGARRSRRSPSRSTPTSSTPPSCSCRSSASCPATDERMRSTIEAIAVELTEDGLVLRYRNDEGLNADGLTGEEGTFVICSFWLVSCLAKAGEVERAEALFDQLAGLRERPRPARRGDRHRERRAARQLPAGVQPHRADHRRLGDRQGAGGPRVSDHYDVIVIGGGPAGRALRRPARRGRPARRDRGARAGRRRVRLLGVHPVEDPAAPGRGAAGGARGAGRARGGERRRATRRPRSSGATSWSPATRTAAKAAWPRGEGHRGPPRPGATRRTGQRRGRRGRPLAPTTS